VESFFALGFSCKFSLRLFMVARMKSYGLAIIGLCALSSVTGCGDGGNDGPTATAGTGGGGTANAGGAGSSSGGNSAGTAGSALAGGSSGGGGSGGQATGGGGSGGQATGGGGSGGAAPVSDNAFEPDVPEEYVGSVVTPGMKVVAHTAREAAVGTEWLMAVKNTSTDYLCAVNVTYKFLDAGGVELADGSGLLDVQIVRGSSGAGGFTNCLEPGKIGMLKDTLALEGVDVAKIAKVTHAFGALILTDASPTTDIKVKDVQAIDQGANGQVFTGAVSNDSPKGVKNPSIAIYGLNAAGRPLFSSEDIELTTIASGASWMFSTTPKFNQKFASFAAYPDVSDL
jgi:hypothetical protein